MPQGLIKFLNFDRGYGFIVPADGSAEVFFRDSVVEEQALAELWEGQQVSYELFAERAALPAGKRRGPRASVVKPLRLPRSAGESEPPGLSQLGRHARSQAKKPSWRR